MNPLATDAATRRSSLHDVPYFTTEPAGGPAQVPRQTPADTRDLLEADLVAAADLVTRIAEALTAATPAAVVLFGMDNLRHVNAAFGPEGGDVALHRTGRLLAWAFAPHPVARLTSDTFGVLLPHSGRAELEHLVRRALSLIAASDLSRTGPAVRTTLSAGVSLLDRPELTARTALHEADLAMSAAKAQGRNRCVVHDALEQPPAVPLQVIAARLRDALERDGFVLHAQPVQGVRRELQQWELLIRLPGADGELLSPEQFLPSAERFGLLQEVDAWVARRAISLIEHWSAADQHVVLEVNVSASTLGDSAFVAMVAEELRRSAIRPGQLVFEVSGEVAGSQLEAVQVFSRRLRELGCRFALDGFGGRGALQQLKLLPLDFVKIDGSLVRGIVSDEHDQRIVRSLTELAHGVGCEVIAMAVGDAETWRRLVGIGVDYVQGFYVGRPIPVLAEE